jgi:hypothetical protein
MRNHKEDELAEMPTLVYDALDALRTVPKVDPTMWARRRQAYLAEVRVHAEASHQAAARPGNREGVSSDPVVRHHSWRAALGALFNFRMREVHPMMIALRLMIMAALVMGGGAGAVAAARDSLPGSLLYPIKVQLEAWELARVDDALRVSERALNQSQVRVWEVNQLTERGRAVPVEVAARYQEQLELALHASNSLDEPLRLKAQSQISETVQRQVRTMAQIAAKADKGDEGQAIQAMIRTMEQTQAQLGLGTGQDGGEGPGGPNQAGPAAGEQTQGDPQEHDEDDNGYGPGDGESKSGPNQTEDGNGPGTGEPKDGEGVDNSAGDDPGRNESEQNGDGNVGSGNGSGGNGNR